MAQINRYISIKECDEIAKKVLNEAGLYPTSSRPTVDIEKLAETYPTVVLDQYAPIDKPKTLGVTTFTDNASLIEINEYVTRNNDKKYALASEKSMWRTTIAHELGHVILHRDIALRGMRGGRGVRIYRCANEQLNSRPRSDNYDPIEYQANMMMAALLMPADLVVDAFTYADVLTESRYELLGDLSEAFLVSFEAIKIRLRELGLG